MKQPKTWTIAGGSLLGAALLLGGCPKAQNPSPNPTPGPGSSVTTDYQPKDYFYPSSATQKNVLLLTFDTDLPGTEPNDVSTASLTTEVTAYGPTSAEVRSTSQFSFPDPDSGSLVASSSVSTASYAVEADGTVVVRMGNSTERYGKGVFTSAGAVISGSGDEEVRLLTSFPRLEALSLDGDLVGDGAPPVRPAWRELGAGSLAGELVLMSSNFNLRNLGNFLRNLLLSL